MAVKTTRQTGRAFVQLPSKKVGPVVAAIKKLAAKSMMPRNTDGGVSGTKCKVTGKNDDFSCGDSD